MSKQATQLYRQPEDKEYTLLAYAKAKCDGARDLAKRIRWANESLEKDFDALDEEYTLSLVDYIEHSEGWDS